MKIIYLLFCSFFIMISCSSVKRGIILDPNFQIIIPPGTTMIEENLYMDKYEMSNIGYREYKYWLKKVFGKNSPEYQSSILDTTIWDRLDSCYTQFSDIYHKGPEFDYYPLVGVTYEQAVQYSKWRSNIVFKLLLV